MHAAGWRRGARDRQRSSNKEQNGFAVRPLAVLLKGLDYSLSPRIHVPAYPAGAGHHQEIWWLQAATIYSSAVLSRTPAYSLRGSLYPLTRALVVLQAFRPVPNFKYFPRNVILVAYRIILLARVQLQIKYSYYLLLKLFELLKNFYCNYDIFLFFFVWKFKCKLDFYDLKLLMLEIFLFFIFFFNI